MAEVGDYVSYLIVGVVAALFGGAVGYIVSNEFGYPFWPVIAISVTVALGITSLVFSSNSSGDTTDGNKVISEGSGDAIGGNQVIEGEKIQEQNIYLGHLEFRNLLWGQEPGIAPEELQKLADEMEQTARSLREYANETSKSGKWSINLAVPVVQDLEKLPSNGKDHVLAKLSQIQSQINEPWSSLDMFASPLAGADLYRVRAGESRLLLDVKEDEKNIYVLAVGHRNEVYNGVTDLNG